MDVPEKASDIIKGMPNALNKEKSENVEAVIHYDISGDNGGKFTIKIDHGSAHCEEGLIGDPSYVLTTTDTVFQDIAHGRQNPQVAMMTGKIKISNLAEAMKLMNVFDTK